MSTKQAANRASSAFPPNVLLLAHHHPSLREMVPLAIRMKDEKRFNPILAGTSQELEQELLRQIEGKATVCQVHPKLIDTNQAATPAPIKLLEWLEAKSPIPALNLWRKWSMLKQVENRAKQSFKKYSPELLLIACDRSLLVQPYIKAARDFGCPVLMVSFALSWGLEWLMRRERNQYRMDASPYLLSKKWMRKKFPDQILDSPVGEVLFYPMDVALALMILGALPPQPWIRGANLCDIVALAGEEDYKRSASMGLKPEKMVITGQPSNDVLFEASQRRVESSQFIKDKYDLAQDDALVIMGVPPFDGAEFADKAEYWDKLEQYLSAMQDAGVKPLLCMHPKSPRDEYLYLKKKYKLSVAQEFLFEIIPVADFYLTSQSSTIRWATLLGTPVLDFDFYGNGISPYSDYQGVLKAADYTEFVENIRMLFKESAAGDSTILHQMAAFQKQTSKSIALFDGQAAKRISDLIDEMRS